jgi:hydrogenase maturation protease
MEDPISLLILGLGKTTHGDDGLGAVALELLARTHLEPCGVRLADAAATLPDPGPGYATVVVDAVRSDAPAGAFMRLAGDEAAGALVSRLPAASLARLSAGDGPLIVLGLVPRVVTPRAGLSPEVSAGLAGLIRWIVLESLRLGHVFRPRPPHYTATEQHTATEQLRRSEESP